MSGELWGEVVACGVFTDHRMVELDLGQCSDGTTADAAAGAQRRSIGASERASS